MCGTGLWNSEDHLPLLITQPQKFMGHSCKDALLQKGESKSQTTDRPT